MAFIGNSSTVDPDDVGADYPSLSAWEAAVAGDFVTATAGERAVCTSASGTADGRVTLDGATTSSVYYWFIECTESHGGAWNTSNFRVQSDTSTGCILINDNDVRITNIQAEGITNDYADGILATGMSAVTGHCLIERCIIRQAVPGGANSDGVNVGWHASTGSDDFPQGFAMSNCIIYDFEEGVEIQNLSRARYIYNCTIHNCTTGINAASANNVRVKNTVCDTCTDGFSGTFHTDSDYNASDSVGDAPGSNSQNGTATTFEDEAGDDFHLGTTDTVCLDNGTDLSGDPDYPISVDNENTTRTGTWDIGAHQAAAPAGTRRVFVVS